MKRLGLLVLSLCLPFSPGFAAQPPNILFAIADDWGLHAGAYGTRWVKTPAFDRVAREGLLFKNAYTPMARCAPSRAIVLTGRHLWQNEEAGNHLAMFPPRLKSWPEVLMENGGGGKRAAARGERFFGYSLRTDRWRYTEWDEGKQGLELYDHRTDAREIENLAKNPVHAATVAELSQQLRAAVKLTFPSSGQTPEVKERLRAPKLAE